MTKKKLIILINKWEGGGAQKVASILSKSLSDRWEQFIIVYKGSAMYPYKGCFINLEKRLPSNKFKKPFHIINRIYIFIKLIKNIRPDIVLSFLENPNFLNIIARILLPKSRYHYKAIISVRSTKRFETFFIEKKLINLLYNRADTIIAVSNGVKKDLVSNFSIKSEKIITIYNPLDIDNIMDKAGESFSNDKNFSDISQLPIIVTCSRLVKDQKNIEMLILAFEKIRNRIPSKLLIIGEGEYKKNLEILARQTKVSDDIIFTGWEKNPYKYICRSALYVLTSNWEGFPNSLIEAMCLSIPVISTNCPSGPSEILGNNRYGILIPPRDQIELEKAIIKLLLDNKLYNHYKKMGLLRAKEFDKDNIILQYESVFLQAVEGLLMSIF